MRQRLAETGVFVGGGNLETGFEIVKWRCGAGWVLIALMLAKWRRQMERKSKNRSAKKT